MNIIDLGIIVVLGLGFLLGWYKGFLVTVLNIASYIGAWLISFAFYGSLGSFIAEKTNLGNTLLYYTAGAEKLSDMSVANINVATLSADRITEIINTSNLPEPIANMMNNNILSQIFAPQGITTLSDYFNQTLINLSISLISFLLIFIAFRVVSMFVVGIIDNVFKLPVLKQADAVLGGAFGIVQGAVFVFIFFSIVPILMSVLPLEDFKTLIQGSLLGRLFFNNNIIFGVLKSVF